MQRLPNYMTAQEFLELWQSTGLTQKQLAKTLGCSQSAISEWKDGKRAIPKKALTIIRLMQENQQLKQRIADAEQSHEADSKPPA
jgi:DNA-binding transcriptional regulator YiaG